MQRPLYIDWFVEEKGKVIKNSVPLTCYKLDYSMEESVWENWALHIRRNYIDDEQLIDDAYVNGMSVEQYLIEYVIPQRNDEFGPTARSGDITEIIVADLLEFVFNYSVPRYKMKNRSGKANSQQGTDVIAYKFYNSDKSPNEKDELIAAEVKGMLSSDTYDPIKSAIKDSQKDDHRLARSIDYCRKRLRELGATEESNEVKRFLLKPDNNYKLSFAAAAVSSREAVDDIIVLDVLGEDLEIRSGQKIFYIHGKKLMELTHSIYERCKK